MTRVTCRLTAKNRDQLRNPTLGSRVWATFTFTRSVSKQLIRRDSNLFFSNRISSRSVRARREFVILPVTAAWQTTRRTRSHVATSGSYPVYLAARCEPINPRLSRFFRRRRRHFHECAVSRRKFDACGFVDWSRQLYSSMTAGSHAESSPICACASSGVARVPGTMKCGASHIFWGWGGGLFACGPAEASVIPNPSSLASFISRLVFTFLVPVYPSCAGKEAVKCV